MLTVLTLSLAALVCVWALVWVHGRRARALLAGMPAFPQVPILGNMLKILKSTEELYHLLLEVTEIMEKEQKPFVFWFGPYPAVLLSDPEDIKAVTTSYVEKPFYYSFGRIWLGNGLVTAPGHIWKHNIKKLAGTFTGSIVGGYQDVFNAQAQKLVDNLKKEVGAGPFDIVRKYFTYTTLETVCQTALGVEDLSEGLVTREYYEAFTRVLELLVSRGLNILVHCDSVYQLTPAYREMVKNVGVLHNLSRTIMKQEIKKKKKYQDIEPNEKHKDISAENDRPKFRSFLDIILELRETDPMLTEEQVLAEVDTIILGGQETVATTMQFIFLCVGSNKRVQDKLYDEIKQVFGNSKRPVEKADLANLPYCEAVICETLRLYPPAPVVMRDADRDLQLSQCVIPKGTQCVVNLFGAGRSRRLWGPDASEYKPERWLESNMTQPAGFLAFSYGKRSCIGKRYAMALLKTVLVYCIRELEFVCSMEKLRLKVDITLKTVSGHLMEVRER